MKAASFALFAPFHEHYVSSFTGVERWRGARTSLGDYLTVHGLFLFLIASGLGPSRVNVSKSEGWKRGV